MLRSVKQKLGVKSKQKEGLASGKSPAHNTDGSAHTSGSGTTEKKSKSNSEKNSQKQRNPPAYLKVQEKPRTSINAIFQQQCDILLIQSYFE